MGYTNIIMKQDCEELSPRWYRGRLSRHALIVDPPRTGLDDASWISIIKYAPEKMVYVSCNVSTWARFSPFVEVYDLHYIQSVDMLPHTARTEVVLN